MALKTLSLRSCTQTSIAREKNKETLKRNFFSLCLMRFRMVCVPRVVSIVCNGILAHFFADARIFMVYICTESGEIKMNAPVRGYECKN